MEKRHPSSEEAEPEDISQSEKRPEKGFSLSWLQRTDIPRDSEHVVYQRSAKTKSEISPERKPRAAAAILGAEYLNQRHDRKLRRQAERLQKRVIEGEKARHELEQIAHRSTEQLRIIQQQQEAFEHRPVPKQEEPLLEIENQQPEHSESSIIPKLEFKPAIAIEHTPEVPPSDILKEVVKAAEFNKPIEDLFEHRAEVKDESTAPGATSVGSVIASLHKDSLPSDPSLGAENAGLSKSESKPLTSIPKRSVYRKAITTGFWLALTLIMLGSLVYFAFKIN